MARQLKKVWLLLVNPAAGGGKTQRLLPLIEKCLFSQKINFEKYLALSRVDFLEKLKEAFQYAGIAVVGGDSAFLMALENLKSKKIPLAFIPTGSQNDIARHLSLTNYQDIAKAMQNPPIVADSFVIASGKLSHRVAGQVNFGLGPRVNLIVENFKKKNVFFYKFQFFIGIFAILASVLKKESPVYMKIQGGQFFIEGFFHIALFTKIQYWGGGFLFAPEASLTDGLINLILVKKCSLFKLLVILIFSYWGKHFLFKEVISHKSGYYFIEFQKPTFAQMDGEIWSVFAKKYKITCKKNGYLLQAKAHRP